MKHRAGDAAHTAANQRLDRDCPRLRPRRHEPHPEPQGGRHRLDRARDILDGLLPARLDFDRDLVARLLRSTARYVDATGVRQRLDPGGNIPAPREGMRMNRVIFENKLELITFTLDGHLLHTYRTTFAQRHSLDMAGLRQRKKGL